MKSTILISCKPPGIIAGTRPVPLARRPHTPARYPVGASRQSADAPEPAPYIEVPADPAARPAAPLRHGPGRPRVLHVDADDGAGKVMATLLAPEALVTTAATLAEARRLLATEVFSLVVLDPALPDGDGRTLLPLLAGTPLLVYCATAPDWRDVSPAYLAKPWTSARQLWVAISGLLGISSNLTAGD